MPKILLKLGYLKMAEKGSCPQLFGVLQVVLSQVPYIGADYDIFFWGQDNITGEVFGPPLMVEQQQVGWIYSSDWGSGYNLG